MLRLVIFMKIKILILDARLLDALLSAIKIPFPIVKVEKIIKLLTYYINNIIIFKV